MHDVVIVGSGPTGLMLAGELALAKVDVAIVERRYDAGTGGVSCGCFHSRTLEIFNQRGITDRFLAEGPGAARAGSHFATQSQTAQAGSGDLRSGGMDLHPRSDRTLTGTEREQLESFLHDNRLEILSLLEGVTTSRPDGAWCRR
jgi:2-polyprenyl-6-methoxyphenol hydroxylase-like FAD-dependent oxidoreductase